MILEKTVKYGFLLYDFSVEITFCLYTPDEKLVQILKAHKILRRIIPLLAGFIYHPKFPIFGGQVYKKPIFWGISELGKNGYHSTQDLIFCKNLCLF
jgi:hypothetical protein